MKNNSKKGASLKILVWIIILVLIVVAIFVAQKIFSSGTDAINSNLDGGEGVISESESQQEGSVDEEKPPRPPE